MSDSLRDYLGQTLNATTSDTNVNVAVECIECGSKKMYINTENGLVCCFSGSCGYKANLVKLLQDVEALTYEQAYIKARALLNDVRSGRSVTSINALVELLSARLRSTAPAAAVTINLELPVPTVRLKSRHAREAREYLARRGYTPRHLAPYEIRYCVECDDAKTRRYLHHMFFIERDDADNIVHWTTRAAFEPSGTYPKSYHPKGATRQLFGLHAAKHAKRSTCVLVEGPLDAIALPTYGVAALGKTISEEHAYTLAKTFEHVIVCLDAGELDALRVCGQLVGVGVRRVQYARCPWKDPGAGVCVDALNTLRAVRNASVPYNVATHLSERMR
jgi:hypothetical protein